MYIVLYLIYIVLLLHLLAAHIYLPVDIFSTKRVLRNAKRTMHKGRKINDKQLITPSHMRAAIDTDWNDWSKSRRSHSS